MHLPVISNYLISNLQAPIAETRTRLEDVSKEAVTGERANLVEHLKGRIGDAFLAKNAIDSISLQRDQLTLRETRLDITQRTLTFIQDSTADLATEFQAAIGREDEAGQRLGGIEAREAIDVIFGALNVRLGERYLFSGDATATAPLPDSAALISDIEGIAVSATDPADFEAQIAAYFDDAAGPWQQIIFAGSASTSEADAISAIDPSISGIIRSLSVIALADGDPGFPIVQDNPAIFQTAAAHLREAQTDLIDTRAGLGLFQEQIARDQEVLDKEEIILTNAYTRIAGRDQFEAATELRNLQTNLEASYLLTNRLSNLSLLNFIR